jgi:DNA/RNA-binding domain of Phe-tRNA-synthetase-like protein
VIPFTSELPIRIALAEFDDLAVGTGDSAFRGLETCATAMRERAEREAIASPGAFPGVQTARGLFRALGIDPTKHRPSSEALLRRALKGKPLPRVNTLVDVGNWWSMEHLLPIGLYDRHRIQGAVTLRLGRADEAYDALTGRTLNLEGRYVLADQLGPFGTPITDSVRTAVSEATSSAAFFVYAAVEDPADGLRAIVEQLQARVVEHCGGRATGLALFEP